MMQAYAEGWELLEKVDLVDNVTEVFRSWREGTVIRSWLLDLLVAALDDDTRPRARSAATPRTPARAAGPSRPRSTTPCRCPAITASLFARFVSRQDDCPAMKAIAAMRNQFGGHAVQAGRPATHRRRRPAGRPAPAPTRARREATTRARRPPVAARLPLLRRPRGRRWSRASPRSSGATGRARPTSSRRSTTSRGCAPPGRR